MFLLTYLLTYLFTDWPTDGFPLSTTHDIYADVRKTRDPKNSNRPSVSITCTDDYEPTLFLRPKESLLVTLRFIQIWNTSSSRIRQMSLRWPVARRRYYANHLRHFRRPTSRGTRTAGCCSCRPGRDRFRRKLRHRAICAFPTCSWKMQESTYA